MAPVATCVVETGRLAQDAAQTNAAVVRLAVSDSASGRGVSFRASVSRTRLPEMTPPTAIAIVTMANPTAAGHAVCASLRARMLNAAIFGASFHPRAKPTRPALAQ